MAILKDVTFNFKNYNKYAQIYYFYHVSENFGTHYTPLEIKNGETNQMVRVEKQSALPEFAMNLFALVLSSSQSLCVQYAPF